VRERLGLELVVLGLADGAAVEERLGLRDLVGRARGAGGLADVGVGRRLVLLRLLLGALGHAVASGDQVDQRGEERHEDQEDDPHRLPPAAELVIAEQVSDDREQCHEVRDEHEGPEEPPDHVPEAIPEIHVQPSIESSAPQRAPLSRTYRVA
jgi:hypothetical protein